MHLCSLHFWDKDADGIAVVRSLRTGDLSISTQYSSSLRGGSNKNDISEPSEISPIDSEGN
jgi:hypothetical protein